MGTPNVVEDMVIPDAPRPPATGDGRAPATLRLRAVVVGLGPAWPGPSFAEVRDSIVGNAAPGRQTLRAWFDG